MLPRLPPSAPMAELPPSLTELDRRLVAAARSIKVLSKLTWPLDTAEAFLAAWRAGEPELPRVPAFAHDPSAELAELDSILAACDRGHPLGDFLYRTAESYRTAAVMLANAGTSRFTECSIRLYGQPREFLSQGRATTLTAAEHLLAGTAKVAAEAHLSDADYCIMPEHVAEEIRRATEPILGAGRVQVVVDPELASKAAAGAQRIRIRGGTCFAKLDIPQLIHHEALVHALTALNGRAQPHLTCLGLGAPRTTRTQEGLALFAEFITGSIDVVRLCRISARVKGIDLALGGADFLDVFRFFLEVGQSEVEAYQSAGRVFRGGDVRGGVAFTKDVVYLRGFLGVHEFLLREIQAGNYRYPHYLFAGRLCTEDVAALAPFFESGLLAMPACEPPWIQSRPTLLAFLLYSGFARELALAGS